MSRAKPIAASTERPGDKAGRRFPVGTLAAHCRKVFGVSSCAFAGATHGLTGSYTISEMKTIIENWKNKEVD